METINDKLLLSIDVILGWISTNYKQRIFNIASNTISISYKSDLMLFQVRIICTLCFHQLKIAGPCGKLTSTTDKKSKKACRYCALFRHLSFTLSFVQSSVMLSSARRNRLLLEPLVAYH